jgi:hypothetical protein
MPSDAVLKLERARRHLAELGDAISAHATAHPPAVEATYSDQGSLTHIQVNVKALPRSASAIIGDVVHNLRAALDILAVNLVNRAGGDSKGVYFPFGRDAEHFEAMLNSKNFRQAGDVAVEAVRNLKPYSGGNDELRGLHDLDIQDKHHAIIPVAALVTTPEVTVTDADFSVGRAKVKLVENSSPAVAHTFSKDGPFGGLEVVSTLQMLSELVSKIVTDLEGENEG